MNELEKDRKLLGHELAKAQARISRQRAANRNLIQRLRDSTDYAERARDAEQALADDPTLTEEDSREAQIAAFAYGNVLERLRGEEL